MSFYRKLKSLFGRSLYIAPGGEVVSQGGFVSGGDAAENSNVGGSIVLPSPKRAAYWTDFLGDLIPDELNQASGDTGNTGAIQAFSGGVYRLQMSSTASPAPGGSLGLNMGSLQWKADAGDGAKKGELRFRTRVKLPTLSVGSRFFGFTDNTSAEMPIYDTGGAIISPAADAVGFLYGERGDTGWHLVAVKSTAGDSGDLEAVARHNGSVVSPVANVYNVLEVVVKRDDGDTGGTAYFYIDGNLVGSIASPVGSAIGLTPTVNMIELNDTGAGAVDIDDWNPSMLRDTGT